ncbi:jmjC domain-containing protein 7 [Lingula anatina]|uniref:Bifunctional peptidase and (3S)-lysyl hydroxylase JMJD7 n=1 Tax=Lingula anatina TaxID=7574 RepID=A0A1S3H1D2_LINAN|nr:jmjC domain-containing protein 7 [Lingula anatina]|eukprot:XP_013379747.1 jmjC domain-containing protein 7 [Lingula anatina]
MSGSMCKNILECFELLSLESEELFIPLEVPVIDSIEPLSFLRDYVNRNVPVVIRGLTEHWPALSKWNPGYLRSKIGQKTVSVAVTPNGYADAVSGNKFVMPEERQITFNKFLDILENKDTVPGIFYIQKQNSNFTEEFPELLPDAESEIEMATKAFGKTPDAVNFWMGDARAVTSLHKDHYENLYCVVKGHKTFILIPPTDQPFIPYGTYQAAHYEETSRGSFSVIDEKEIGKVPWIPVDPLNPDTVTYPLFAKAHILTVTVHEGETLYLPSLWFHHVQQSHGCIAVNYWYDMEYDIKYSYFKFVESLTQFMTSSERREKHVMEDPVT